MLNELGQELKSSKGAERKFYAQEIKKLREEQDKLKEKLNNLFDMRLDGELDRETFDLKRNEIQVKINRLKNKVTAHEKADNSFDETLLGLLDIATQAGNIFERSQNLDLKRLLLKFVFESLTLTEGVLTYKLKFPFNEFVNSNILMAQAAKAYEPKQTLINQGLTENDNENVQFGSLKSYEPQILDKKQEVTLKNATSLQIGFYIYVLLQNRNATLIAKIMPDCLYLFIMRYTCLLLRFNSLDKSSTFALFVS